MPATFEKKFDKSVLDLYQRPKRHGKLSEIIPNGDYALMQTGNEGAVIKVSHDKDDYDLLSMENFTFDALDPQQQEFLNLYASGNRKILAKSDRFTLYKLWDKTTKNNVWFWRGLKWD